MPRTNLEEEVAAQSAVVESDFEGATGCGYDPGVDRDCLIASDPAQFALLQHGKQFDLQIWRQFADFVEEDCPTVSLFEKADLAARRAGERIFFMTEEF